ncbi:hypothetical protein [Thermoproteus uzoniensis]|uniref:hypothetical protein n=1 Tax=Thermoproteus uzoniensis TaxID=184117 RepID=UPI00069AC7E7|nr:hypothetical protein [Thermoproteus uzoniensis]
MRLALLLALLISAVVLAESVSVTIEAVDGFTGHVLNSCTIMVWQGNNLLGVSYGPWSGDLAPGTYLVQVLAFQTWFNQTISVPSTNPIQIVIPTAFIHASVWDDAMKRYANWTVEILGPDNSTKASGRGGASVEVVANGARYRAAALTPYGVFYSDWAVPQPGQNLTLEVKVPTALVSLVAYDEALGRPANFTIVISGNGANASGVGVLKRELVAGTYEVEVVANLSGGVFRYSKTMTLSPGANYSEVLRVPTAFLYIYAQTPAGSPVPNATIMLYEDGRLLVNSTGPSLAVEVLGGRTYTAVARYRNLTATANATAEPGARVPVYLNLSATVGTVIRVTPKPATTTRAASSTTKTAQTTTAKPPTPSSTTTAPPPPPPPGRSPWAYFIAVAGAIALALAAGVLALAASASRRSEASEDLGLPEVVEAA